MEEKKIPPPPPEPPPCRVVYDSGIGGCLIYVVVGLWIMYGLF